jgi:uncharacterized protein (TIGR03435 family)
MRLPIACGLSLAALACVASDAVWAQGNTRSFEVASVRLTVPNTPPSRRVTNTRVDVTNISLHALLVRVFRIDQPSRLSAPDWLTGVRVDIHATLPEGSTREHVPEMLKTLLVTRFGLGTHVELRPADVHELVTGSGVGMQEVPAIEDIDTVFPADRSTTPSQIDRTTDSIEAAFAPSSRIVD